MVVASVNELGYSYNQYYQVELLSNNQKITSQVGLPQNMQIHLEVGYSYNQPSQLELLSNSQKLKSRVELPTNKQQIYQEFERKYYGGMRSAFVGSKKQGEKIDYEGIRVTNFGHDCYINAATNIIVTNSTIMAEIQKVTEDFEPAGGKRVL